MKFKMVSYEVDYQTMKAHLAQLKEFAEFQSRIL